MYKKHSIVLVCSATEGKKISPYGSKNESRCGATQNRLHGLILLIQKVSKHEGQTVKLLRGWPRFQLRVTINNNLFNNHSEG